MKVRRGSAVMFVLVLLTIMATMMLSYATLSVASATSETRREQATIAQYLFAGATLKAAEDAGDGVIAVPSSTSESVGPFNVNVTVGDNGGSLAHSLTQSSSINLYGRTYTDTRVTALKTIASPFWYAVATNNSLNLGQRLITGSAGSNGDIYSQGNITLQPGSSVNGDVDCSGSLATNSAYVSGTAYTGQSAISFPAVNASDYTSIGGLLLGLLGGNSFSSSYAVNYLLLGGSASGTYQGKGIIYVNGNLTISGDMSYGSSTDDVLFIVSGNVSVSSSVTNIVGYYYVGGSFNTNGAITVTRGAIAANSVSAGGPLTVNYDPTIWTTIGEAKRMKMPGFWP